eukprot:scaffold1756_cov117-Isochrysis_galbana.AAC.13
MRGAAPPRLKPMADDSAALTTAAAGAAGVAVTNPLTARRAPCRWRPPILLCSPLLAAASVALARARCRVSRRVPSALNSLNLLNLSSIAALCAASSTTRARASASRLALARCMYSRTCRAFSSDSSRDAAGDGSGGALVGVSSGAVPRGADTGTCGQDEPRPASRGGAGATTTVSGKGGCAATARAAGGDPQPGLARPTMLPGRGRGAPGLPRVEAARRSPAAAPA